MIQLEAYRTTNERATYKNIPIVELKTVQAMLKGQGFRYIFRGPRYDATRGSTRKKDAWGFSVYRVGYY